MNYGEVHTILVNILRDEWPKRDTTAIPCQRCGRPLDVHYAEERLYVVRCGACKTVILTHAPNPYTAAWWYGREGCTVERGAPFDEPIAQERRGPCADNTEGGHADDEA